MTPPPDPSGFGFESTADEVLAGVDLSGRVAAVTGASGGLGLETARALAARGAHVVLAARSTAKLDEAAASIRSAILDASIETLTLDLADVGASRRSAIELLGRIDRLDLVVNNAGVMCTPFGHTADGFETQFGTNHLGHMAWTIPLLDQLQRSAADGSPSRVVNLSSAGHRFGDVRFDDPNFEQGDYDPWEAYGQSKTANVLFSVALDAQFGHVGIRSVAVHPGGIHTDLGRHMTPEMRAVIQSRIEQSNPGGFSWKSVPQGAATTVWAATTPEFVDRGGVYCEDCGVAEVVDSTDAPPGASTGERTTGRTAGGADSAGDRSGGVLARAIDPERAGHLWDLSAELLATVT
ncbi:MAG: SDR family NAD(P)-dependent oxidoreductase [Actinomycetota bacterium]